METTIEVAGLRKRFGRTLALDGMTFTVSPGHITGFIGPNGAGKSTTMRVILGLDQVVADLVDELRLRAERLRERPRHRLPDFDHPDARQRPAHGSTTLTTG